MEALALLEFESIARGVLAIDRLLKRAPVSRLRCGTIHPGRYQALCGGSVASVEEAYREAAAAGDASDGVLLPDPHPGLQAALAAGEGEAGTDFGPEGGGDLLVLECASSPTLVRLLDGILKAVPVTLPVLRLADDLGGRAFAILAGDLADLEDARTRGTAAKPGRPAPQATIVARPDPDLRACLAATTRFAPCPPRAVAAGERPLARSREA